MEDSCRNNICLGALALIYWRIWIDVCMCSPLLAFVQVVSRGDVALTFLYLCHEWVGFPLELFS